MVMAVFDGMRNIAQNYREAVSPTPVSLTKETGFKHQRRFPDVLRECGELARKTGAYAVSFYDAGTAEFTFCPYSHNSQYRVALLNDSRDPRESFTGAEIGALNDFVRARGGTVRIYSETFNPNGFGNITFPYVQPGQERTRQERIEHREEVEVKERIFPLLPFTRRVKEPRTRVEYVDVPYQELEFKYAFINFRRKGGSISVMEKDLDIPHIRETIDFIAKELYGFSTPSDNTQHRTQIIQA